MPAAMVESRRTAARVMRGATSLSNSSHFAPIAYSKAVNPVGIAARPRQATDQARADRVDDATKHDRHCAGRLLHCGHVKAGIGNDNVRRKRHQFHRMSAANVDTARGPADVKARIAAVGPAQFRQPLDESGELSPPPRIALVRTQEHAHAPDPLALLRARRQRPRRRAAEQRDELATADHSIISSAMANTPGGISTPSALAVLRLITRLNLLLCKTGRSAGFAPMRMRPTYT